MSYIVLPRRRKRPDRFELDYGHPLAQGLVLAGMGQMPGSARYTDASIVGNHGVSGSARWRSNLGRQWLNQNGTSERIALAGAYPQFTEWTFSVWTDWTTRVGENNTLLGGGQVGAPSAETPGSNNLRLRILAGSDHAYIYALCGATNSEWAYVWNQAAIRGIRNLTFVKTPLTVELFVDGKSAGSKANVGTFFWNRLVSIGGNTDGTYPYGGNLADPLIYNRALSLAEISILANPTDPMLAGLIKEKRTAQIYFLSSVNHWELQIKIDDGEWVDVPNMSSEIAEYIKSTGLTSGTYYARIRKFTNGVPSDWEYATGVVYSTGGGGTPYSLTQALLASLGLEFGSSASAKAGVSAPYMDTQDSLAAISAAVSTSQDARGAVSQLFTLTQDAAVPLSSSHIDICDLRAAISTDLSTLVQDALAAISDVVGYAVTQSVLASIATELAKTVSAKGRVSEPYAVTFDGRGKVLQPVGVTHDGHAPIQTSLAATQAARASLVSTISTAVSAKAGISHIVTFVSDALAAIGLGVSYTMTLDGRASVSVEVVARQDAVVAISTNVSEIFDAAGKISSGYIVVQDGRAVVIDVDVATMTKIELPTVAMLEYSGLTVARLSNLLTTSARLKTTLPTKTKAIFIKIGG